MQEALLEAMRLDFEEGGLSDALLNKIGGDDSKKENNSSSSSATSLGPHLMKSDLNLLKKLHTEV
jgi:hypothetical protein